MSQDERRERVETVIIAKFADELELTPAEAEQFYPRLRQFRAKTEPMQRELAETRRELDNLSNSNDKGTSASKSSPTAEMSFGLRATGKDDLKALIAKSNSLQTGILAHREQFLTELADFLTPQQVSRCSILLDELPRRIRQFMDERGGPPPGEERGHGTARQQRRQAR